ncbi:outer membrane protein [Shinella fusca]|jgi:outer membrane immunogenic protein|uniref:Outer membrane immunogenic protein n=1 Tax=Shinella fusca TaxID=544480 RepID=A0A7W7YRF1_9HYPH|nr:outer membrane protein [Shinella fusca]MBB5040975.1 outer membrane immunogenic protein [Shinella fusca]
MKSMIFGAAGILLSASAIPAFSADMAVAEPPVETPITEVAGVYDWGGFYVGVNTGYAWTGVDYSAGGASLVDRDLNGFALGGYAGYNFFNDGWVYGVEADIKRDFNDERFDAGAGTTLETETTWGGSVRARIGYAIDRTLIYGTGGYAFTHAKLNNVTTGASEGETLHGWTIGAGVEHAFTDNVAGRVEYRYSDYSKSDVFGAAGLDGDIDSHAIMVGVSMKF